MGELTLGDLCLEVIDCEHKTAPEDPLGQFWSIGTPAMAGNKIDYAQSKRISEATYRAWTRRGRPKAGDIILAREAPVGPVVRVPDSPPVALGQRTVLLRPDPGVVDPGFLYYGLVGDEMQALMKSRAEGSTVAHLNVAEVRELRFIDLPSLQEQRAIAGVLGALDDKIESNRRIAAQAAELAKTELLAAPASRTVRLGEVAKVAKGLSYKGDGLADEGVPMVNMGSAANFGWLKRTGFKHYTGAFKAKHIAHPGDVLVVNTEQTWRNEIIGWPMIVPGDVGDVLFTHHIFRADFDQGFKRLRLPCWASLFEPSTRAMLDSMVYGTTVATLPAEALERVEIRVPDNESAIEAASALLERVWEAERETSNLERLRDALLPELLSGRRRVRDAEEMVGSA